MRSGLPPMRWRVVERGRRLVTIDTATGQEIGLGAILPNVNLDARPRDHQPRPAQRASLAAPAKASVPVASVPIVRSDQRAASPSPMTAPTASPGGQVNTNKLILLATACIFLLFILIFSGAWIFAAVALFFAPVRQAILPPVWAKLKNWLQAA